MTFEKPSLGIVEVFGSTANNLVYHTKSGPAQTGVFYDEKDGVFRAFGGGWPWAGAHMGTASSFDGIHKSAQHPPPPPPPPPLPLLRRPPRPPHQSLPPPPAAHHRQ
eukprot:COSAG04_NODE_1424_length_6819_cov_3.386905_9_plen_106_part_01